jgi:hypothetical protein
LPHQASQLRLTVVFTNILAPDSIHSQSQMQQEFKLNSFGKERKKALNFDGCLNANGLYHGNNLAGRGRERKTG